MKKRIFTLLCALALLLPALCSAYVCDSCDYDGPFTEVITGEEVRDGAPGVWYVMVCPSCGAPSPAIPPSWRQTGPAVADPPPAVHTNPEPPKTDPEPEVKTNPALQQEENNPSAQGGNSGQPVTVQPEAEAQSPGTGNAAPEEPVLPPVQPEVPAGSGGTENAVQTAPEQPASQPDTAQVPPVSGPDPADAQPQPAAEPLPPVPEENPAPQQPASQSGNAPAAETAPDNPDPAVQGGNTYLPKTRDLKKYPIFSASRPSRRLNLEGDPDAWAPIPGEKIYPPVPEEGSSILRHMLDGD